MQPGEGYPFDLQRITPADIQQKLKTGLPNTIVDIAFAGGSTSIRPGYQAQRGYERADVFVYWHREVDASGTYMYPRDLFDYLEPTSGSREASHRLLGSYSSQATPLVTLQSPNRLVQVHIFAGCLCPEAQTISAIGNEGRYTPKQRVAYQREVAKVIRPWALRGLGRTTSALGLYPKSDMIWDVDDCLAAGVTLGGESLVLEALGYPSRPRRIDVTVATAQALVMIAQLAESPGRQQPTEINVGYMAWALAPGVGPQQLGKNYIIQAPFVELGKVFAGSPYVVADMGAAGEEAEGAPWNSFRRVRNGQQDSAYSLDQAGSLQVYYARGGEFIEALADYIRYTAGQPHEPSPRVMTAAKRLTPVDPNNAMALAWQNVIEPFDTYFFSRR
jgi:hypothetical protein